MSGSTSVSSTTMPAASPDTTVSVDPHRIISKLSQKVGELTTQHTFLSTAYEQVSEDLYSARSYIAALEMKLKSGASDVAGAVAHPVTAAEKLIGAATDDAEKALGLAATAQNAAPTVNVAATTAAGPSTEAQPESPVSTDTNTSPYANTYPAPAPSEQAAPAAAVEVKNN